MKEAMVCGKKRKLHEPSPAVIRILLAMVADSEEDVRLDKLISFSCSGVARSLSMTSWLAKRPDITADLMRCAFGEDFNEEVPWTELWWVPQWLEEGGVGDFLKNSAAAAGAGDRLVAAMTEAFGIKVPLPNSATASETPSTSPPSTSGGTEAPPVSERSESGD